MSHISFSELVTWKLCPYKHKLMYIDKLREFHGNEFTSFGTAIHDVCESAMLNEEVDMQEMFLSCMDKEISSLRKKGTPINEKLLTDLVDQGIRLVTYVMPGVKQNFGSYKVISTEEKLMVPTDMSENYNFKGFIDLVIQTDDGKYHVIDWKTCSWGWDLKKKTDPMITYQLTLYKHFFAKKHKIDPKMVETHFALLKRTAKDNNVEIFRVTSGARKTKNALTLLEKAIYNIKAKTQIKNRLSCRLNNECEFLHTKYCTR